jgi:hypothetical protein
MVLKCTYRYVAESWDALPHRCIFPDRIDVAEPFHWSLAQFGDRIPWRIYESRIMEPEGRWAIHNDRMFSFRDETDAFAFKIRWG